ncbi:MAG: hypothetical protein ACK5Q5_24120 [Planctomycetaceae bacterium]
MAWTLNLRASPDRDDTGSIGSRDDVRNAVSSVIPSTRWISDYEAIVLLRPGAMHLTLHGSPVETVEIAVTGNDPSRALRQLADDRGWYIEDESTGAQLSVNPDSPVLDFNVEVDRKLPRIRQKRSWNDGYAARIPEARVRLVGLDANELPVDLFYRFSEYHQQLDLPATYQSFVRMVSDADAECMLPCGLRFAVFYFGPKADEDSYALVAGFCQSSGRLLATIRDGSLVLPYTAEIPLAECQIVGR